MVMVLNSAFTLALAYLSIIERQLMKPTHASQGQISKLAHSLGIAGNLGLVETAVAYIKYHKLDVPIGGKKWARKFLDDLLLNKKQKITPEVKKAISKSFYSSREWLELRYKALTTYGAVCQCCGATAASTQLHVDHILPKSKYPEKALEISNLQILCRECNVGKSNKDNTDWRAT